MKLRILLSLLLLFAFFNVIAQPVTYFLKIQTLATKTRLASELYEKIDSLKQTRRPNQSSIKILFNRDVDFGYTQKRIQIEFNARDFYQLNLLIKNDTICLSSTIFSSVFGPSPGEAQANKTLGIPSMDTIGALNYLKLRNRFYKSTKTLNDLKNEINLNEIYALNGGDGYNETWYKKHIDTLVRRKNYVELEAMLKRINCETQTYGVTAFNLLKKSGHTIPLADQKIIDHIKRRNSEIESTEGDLGPIIWKAYK